MADLIRRALLVAAGLFGAVGVMSAAMASHGEGVRNLAAISTIALAHAPVLLILALGGKGRALAIAAVVLAVGCVIFIVDLAMRQWVGMPLFPGAAPLGGGALIIGWLLVAVSAAFRQTLKD